MKIVAFVCDMMIEAVNILKCFLSLKHLFYIIVVCLCVCGSRGGIVVKAQRYKPAGYGFDSRWCNWNFSVK
jgi:hypothetical protein